MLDWGTLEAGLSGNAALEFVDAGAGLGARNDYVFGRDVELLFDGCCLADLLGAAELVGLGEADDKVELVAPAGSRSCHGRAYWDHGECPPATQPG